MRKTTSGFTLVEVLIVVAIIGILTAVGFVSYDSIQSGARDSQRSSRVTILAEALEKYYDQNGEYPSCNAMADTTTNISANTLVGIDTEVLSVPGSADGTNSILPSCADLTTSDNFAYVGDGSNSCLSGSACLQYVLKYKEEATGNVISLAGRRTVTNTAIAVAPEAPTVTVNPSGGNIVPDISPVTCTDGSAQYEINKRINDGTWEGYTTWGTEAATESVATRTSAEGVKYGYMVQARCFVTNFSYSTNIAGLEGTYIKPIITIPATPTVVASTPNYSTTSYSWSTSACPTGTSARYQYDFYTSYGFDFGWVATPATSASFTTSTFGYTYSVQAKAQCYNSYYSSADWSGVGFVNYYRPIPTVKVLVVAGGGAGGSSSSDDSGGGGGGGGVVYHSSKSVGNQNYSIIVGNGGTSSGANGQDSSAMSMLAKGGGGGGMTNEGGNDGGSGGGGAGAMDGSTNSRGNSIQSVSGGESYYGFGGGLGQWRNDGKAGGGGGGAGMIGGSGHDGGGNGKMTGGNGMQSSITGTNTYYAAGGGGGSCCYWGAGGAGGGGNGAQDGRGNNATANTGSGGGGGSSAGGGNGGSGIVLVRYASNSLGAAGGPTIITGSDTVMLFYSSGTFQVY